jgi:hypothetical protein
MQPLASGSFAAYTGFFCGLFAALLGWLQGYRERHRDLWSFLVHRPMSRTGIFFAKVLGGLTLYGLAAGLPLLVFIGWAMIPRHVAAPFEWAMLKPVLLFFLLGGGSYFAGMLTSLRQARWYASRGLPLGMALAATVAACSVPGFGRGLFLALFADALLLLSTWAAFQTNGFYRAQTRPGRLVLPAVLMFGAIPVLAATLILLNAMLPRWASNGSSWSAYQMLKDGRVCKVIWSELRRSKIVDLEDHVLLNPKTGQPLQPDDYPQLGGQMANNTYLQLAWGNQYVPNVDVGRLTSLFKLSDKTLWYYSQRYGRLLAYDVLTRGFIGSLGPDGFLTSQADTGARFDYPPAQPPGFSYTLHSATTLYRIDLDRRSSTAIYHTDSSHPILCSADVPAVNNQEIPAGRPEEQDFVAVAISNHIGLLTLTGKLVWETPFEPGYQGHTQLSIWTLEPRGNFALWVTPSQPPNRDVPQPEPTRVTWFTDGRTTKSIELPELQVRQLKLPLEAKLMSLMMPPVVMALIPVFLYGDWPGAFWAFWIPIKFGLLAAILICVPLGGVICRRYSFSFKSIVAWTGFLLFTGIPGLLAFLSAHEWPARESCPQCGRKRIVDRERCEHCGAAFPPPDRLGIEIFEAEGTPALNPADMRSAPQKP